MELRIWNDTYYIHSCSREGYADVSEYTKDSEGYYCCVSFCGFKFPSLIVTKPLPLCKKSTFIYGHKVIACVIKKREVFKIDI